MFAFACLLSCGGVGRSAEITELRERQTKIESRLTNLEMMLQLLVSRLEAGPAEEDPNQRWELDLTGSPQIGPSTAPVTIVMGYEFACRFCYFARDKVKALRGRYGDKIRVVFLNFLVHPDEASPPALAACAANEQGKFWEMSELIWDRGFANGDLSMKKMQALANEIGLKGKQFEADVAGSRCRSQLDRDQKVLKESSVRGTPTFFVNGKKIVGNQELEVFTSAVDRALAETTKGP